jgi:hypothetical protein
MQLKKIQSKDEVHIFSCYERTEIPKSAQTFFKDAQHPTTILYRATSDVRYGIRQTDKKNYLFLMATRNEIPDATHALEDVRRS